MEEESLCCSVDGSSRALYFASEREGHIVRGNERASREVYVSRSWKE